LLLAGLLAATAGDLSGQDSRLRPAPEFTGGGRPDQAEGARILDEFRRAGIAGDYWLAFELRVLPRKGAERSLTGRMFGTRGPGGPLTRLSLPAGAEEKRWLIQSGPHPAAWRWLGSGGEGGLTGLQPADCFEPIAGTDIAVFDLQMPFLYWTDFVFEGIARVRGRPAHRVLLYPPADLAGVRPELTGVRVFIDTQFQAMLQAELLGPDGKPAKTITVLDLKKSGEQWMVKSLDVRNHRTRDKTRFTVLAAALDLALPRSGFEPAGLALEPPVIPEAKIQRF
jgi:hypothetical protein